jgi:hypothetical protein
MDGPKLKNVAYEPQQQVDHDATDNPPCPRSTDHKEQPVDEIRDDGHIDNLKQGGSVEVSQLVPKIFQNGPVRS